MFALCCYAENAAGEVRATGINERRSGSAKGAHRRGSNRQRKGGGRKGGRAQKGIKNRSARAGHSCVIFRRGSFRLRLFSGGSFGFPDDVIGHFGKITHNGKCQRQGCQMGLNSFPNRIFGDADNCDNDVCREEQAYQRYGQKKQMICFHVFLFMKQCRKDIVSG